MEYQAYRNWHISTLAVLPGNGDFKSKAVSGNKEYQWTESYQRKGGREKGS